MSNQQETGAMRASSFNYVSYMRATPQQLWDALTLPEITPKYWMGAAHATDWKAGAPWALKFADGRIADDGSIAECDPPRKLVLNWQHRMHPELTTEGVSRCEISLEAVAENLTSLTVVHTIGVPDSKFIAAVSWGWPMILSSLKSLLETGQPLAFPSGVKRPQ